MKNAELTFLLLCFLLVCGCISAPREKEAEQPTAPAEATAAPIEETPMPTLEQIVLEAAVITPAPTTKPTEEPTPTPKPTPVPTPEPTATPVPSPSPEPADRWEALKWKYLPEETVQELIFVKYQGGSTAHLELWQKNAESEDGWALLLECRAHVGLNGIDKKKEGDKRTPTGDFGILTAFGIKSDPGTQLPYFKVTRDMYCCADEEFYNKIVSKNDMHHKCTGEHLIDYKPCYNYCMFPDYNEECEFGKGSAIFIHCYGSKVYTGGCVAVSEKNMKTILQSVHPGLRVCIYNK